MVHIKRIEWSIVAALVVSGAMIGGAMAFAQDDFAPPGENTVAISGITFPVPELGNCGSKEECKQYCDEAAHINECVAFASSRGLMNKEEAQRAEKFAVKVQSGEAPGGCNSPVTCKAYCEDLAHIDECVVFAEKNEFKGAQYEQGKKINEFLKSGGQTPGGCTSKVSCEAYCGDFSHAEECFAFAQKAGIAQSKGGGRGGPPGEESEEEMPTPEQFRKLAELAKNGEMPGGCKSKGECEAYCSNEANMDECIAFGEKAGFMTREEAQKAKTFMKAGGPGGCKSRQECESFCNNPANRETCFKFAEENGLISKEEIARAKEGIVRMRQGFEDAPPEVRECLSASLGTNIIEDIQSGKLVPGEEIGDRMRGCFEKHGANHNPREVFENAPPEVLACLKEKTGDQFAAIEAGEVQPTPEIADAFRLCFQQQQFEEGGWGMPHEGEMGEGEEGMGREGMGRPEMGQQGGMGGAMNRKPPSIGEFMRTAPPEVAACVREQLGDDATKIESGEAQPTAEIGQKIKSCFQQFHPQDPTRMGNPQEGQGGSQEDRPYEGQGNYQGRQGEGMRGDPVRMTGWIVNLPAPVTECLKGKFGEEMMRKIAGAGPTQEVEAAVRACQTQYGQQQMGVEGRPMEGNYGPPSTGGGQFPSGAQSGGYLQGGMENGMIMGEERMPPPSGTTGGYMPQGTMDGQYPPPPSGTQYQGYMPPQEGSYNMPPPGDSGGYMMPPPPSVDSGTEAPPPQETQARRPSLTSVLAGVVFGSFEQLWNLLK